MLLKPDVDLEAERELNPAVLLGVHGDFIDSSTFITVNTLGLITY